MADVILETSGLYDIKPKGNDGKNKNLIPNYDISPHPSLGTGSDRWQSAVVVSVDASGDVAAGGDVTAGGNASVGGSAQINTDMEDHGPVFLVNGDSSSSDAQVLIGASSTDHRVYLGTSAMTSTGTDARTIMAQENTEGAIPVASFKQRDDDAPFLDFEGECDNTGTLSLTNGNGNGSVVGPKAKNTASFGFEYAGMEKVRADVGNGSEELWSALYRRVTS